MVKQVIKCPKCNNQLVPSKDVFSFTNPVVDYVIKTRIYHCPQCGYRTTGKERKVKKIKKGDN